MMKYLNGVNIVGDDNELSFLLLDQGRDGVDSVTEGNRALGGSVLLAGCAGLGPGLESGLAVLLSLGTVLVQKAEKLSSCKTKKFFRID
jgi:hypothetical protein